MKYGIQLYSIKDVMAADVKDAITKIGQMGYKSVEAAGFFGYSAEDFKKICDEAGVTVDSTHTGFSELDNDFDGIVAYLKTLGCKRYILPWVPVGTKEEIDDTVEKINKYQPMLAKEGIELMFHNHWVEFVPNRDGLIPHIELQRRTNIKFQIDVYWAYRGLVNPIYVLESLKDRIDVIHLKDGDMTAGKPLGQGTAPIFEVVKWAKANGVDMVVENEPTADRQLVEAKQCIDYLKAIENI
ncbi:MAG: sugar phosphate isomerase/epimerase [Acutalibacteraceae bacterium]|nr:sugar phosphate isomerase/epimerase [Acutalibacteraceae bacterium]